jgi:pantetheine-phosphate adenylyltransferase
MSKDLKRTGIYPGTFDPITKGHLHIIKRASHLVDHLFVAIAENPGKGPLFTLEERMALVKQDIENLPDKGCTIEVVVFNNLLVDFARQKGATCVFRGLRAVSDFEYEFQMTGMNAKLAPDVETVFLMASDKWQFVSSAFVKEIARLGGEIEQFVTPQVQEKVQAAFKAR